jgi:hypothetical protein
MKEQLVKLLIESNVTIPAWFFSCTPQNKSGATTIMRQQASYGNI